MTDEKHNIENEPQEPSEASQTATDAEQEPATDAEALEDQETPQTDEETFPRAYVEKLRKEAGDARARAKRTDELAHRLHVALVAATGRLADPSDLDFADEHLDDSDALATAIDDLLARKPHLASRRPRGDIGQGRVSDPSTSVNIAGILRSHA